MNWLGPVSIFWAEEDGRKQHGVWGRAGREVSQAEFDVIQRKMGEERLRNRDIEFRSSRKTPEVKISVTEQILSRQLPLKALSLKFDLVADPQ